MTFLLICHDRTDAGDLRSETRDRHLDYLGQAGDQVLLAGPMLSDDGQPIGSLLIIEAADAAEAKTFADNDPYALAGLFEKVDIRPYRMVTGALKS